MILKDTCNPGVKAYENRFCHFKYSIFIICMEYIFAAFRDLSERNEKLSIETNYCNIDEYHKYTL